MSRENPDSSMDIACNKLIIELMKPYIGEGVIFLDEEALDALLYEALQLGYSQGAEDWYD